MWPIELSTKKEEKKEIIRNQKWCHVNWKNYNVFFGFVFLRKFWMEKSLEKFSFCPVLSVPWIFKKFVIIEKESKSPSLSATHSDSRSCGYSLASCQSPSMAAAAIFAVGGCVAFGSDDAVTRQTLLPVDWLNVNLETMRMAWTMIRCRLRSLMDYHTKFECSRCHDPPRREWAAWWNADVVLTVVDGDYFGSDAGDSTADGLDGVSVLPKEATSGNWLVLTCCDDMNATRGIVSPKTTKFWLKIDVHFSLRGLYDTFVTLLSWTICFTLKTFVQTLFVTHFIIWIVS